MAKITLTKRTRKYRRLTRIFAFLSIFCLMFPLLFALGTAWAENNLIIEKFAATAIVIVGGIITAICIGKRLIVKSRTWLLILILYLVIDAFLPVLLLTAICEVLNELIFERAYAHCREIYITNLEQDRRP